MATSTRVDPQLVKELMNTEGRAEIIGGRVVTFPPLGAKPGRAVLRIAVSLMAHAEATGVGEAATGTAAFLCDLPNRNSLSPDVSFYTGPDNPDDDMDFYPEAPIFAVEVRSKNDYGPNAERAIHARIADYFAAGTLVVWDVDLLGENIVSVYRRDNPDQPTVYRRGQLAEAEPAVPGWTIAVDDLFH